MYIKICKLLLITVLTFAINSAVFAADVPKIRELPSNSAVINNQVFNNSRDNIYKSKDITKKLERNLSVNETNTTTRLKGGISELKAIVGKSQIIKFDEPVKRISITNPSLADLVFISPKEMLINGKVDGETSLIIWGEKGDPVMFNLVVQNNTTTFYTLLKEVRRLAPNDNIKIELVDSGNSVKTPGGSIDIKKDGGKTGNVEIPKGEQRIIITGKFSSTYTKEKVLSLATSYGYSIINMSESLTPQVMLEVKIVEFTKTHNKTSNTTPTLYFNNVDEKINALTKLTYNLKFNSDGTYSGVVDQPSANLQMALKKAESEGTAKILAEPRLMTINDKKATFKSSDEIPVITGRDEYGGLIIGSKSVGVNLEVTPTILEESGRILLDIKPNISNYAADAIATVDGFPVYKITTRETDSVIEVADNQTIVIGGLIRTKSDLQKTKVPFFGNLPIIGNILGDSTYTNEETELMIFVTPTIIKPDDVVDGV